MYRKTLFTSQYNVIPNKAQSHSPLLQDANGYSGNRMQNSQKGKLCQNELSSLREDCSGFFPSTGCYITVAGETFPQN